MGTGHYLKHRAGCCWVTSSGQPQQNTLPLCKAEENFAEPGSRQLVVYHASCNLFACVSLSLSLFPFAGSSSFFFRAGWLTQLTGASNEWCVYMCVCVCVYVCVYARSRPPAARSYMLGPDRQAFPSFSTLRFTAIPQSRAR